MKIYIKIDYKADKKIRNLIEYSNNIRDFPMNKDYLQAYRNYTEELRIENFEEDTLKSYDELVREYLE